MKFEHTTDLFINHAATPEADGRQVLELRCHHVFHLDSYRCSQAEGPLPSEGSFTWELVVRIDSFAGTNHWGMLIDASKGAGRLLNYGGAGANRSINTRLLLKPIKEHDDEFQLCFTVPTSDQNTGVMIKTPLKKEQWYHLAAVYDDQNHESQLYVDGKKVTSAPVVSCPNRSKGFGLAGAFGPDVFRVDHQLFLHVAMFDAIAMTDDVRQPGSFVLSK